jgi:O-antigen/teichoic acid export membrane protein
VGIARKIVINTIFLTIGQFATIIAGIIWTALFARYIGPQMYGLYAYAQSILAILVIFVNFGFDQLIIRDVAKNPSLALLYLKMAISVKVILAVVIFVGIIVFGITAHWSTLLIFTFMLVSLITFVEAFMAVSRSELYAQQVMHLDTLTVVLRSIMVLSFGGLAIWLNLSFITILLVILIASVISTALNYFFSLRTIMRIPAEDQTRTLPVGNIFSFVVRSLPFAALLSISVLYANVMVIIIKWLIKSDVVVGEFAAAQRIYTCMLIIPNMFLQSILPAFSTVFVQSVDAFKAMFERSYRFIFILTVPMAFVVWCVAPDIVKFLYGSDYAQAGPFLRVLGLGLINGVGFVMGPAMLAMDKQKIHAVIYGAALVIVVVAAYVLIPVYGAMGACWALVFGTLLGFFVYSFFLFKMTHLRYPISTIIKTCGASIIMMCVLTWVTHYVHFIISAFIIAPAIYFLCHLVGRTLSLEDIHKLQGVLPRFARPFMLFWSRAQDRISHLLPG